MLLAASEWVGGWALRLVGLCGDLVLAWAMFKVMDEKWHFW